MQIYIGHQIAIYVHNMKVLSSISLFSNEIGIYYSQTQNSKIRYDLDVFSHLHIHTQTLDVLEKEMFPCVYFAYLLWQDKD